jgi:hypothetical protein
MLVFFYLTAFLMKIIIPFIDKIKNSIELQNFNSAFRVNFWHFRMQKNKFIQCVSYLGAGASSRGSLHMSAASSATLYQSLRENTAGRPFILCILQSGKAHGVLFEASGALEIVTRRSNLISVRTTAGVAATLKVHTFVGDSPAEVFDALTQYTGQRGNFLLRQNSISLFESIRMKN